jgi:hypothetical protein
MKSKMILERNILFFFLLKDMEDTIIALKAQIDSLQKRTILLQSELDDRNQLVNSSTCSASL